MSGLETIWRAYKKYHWQVAGPTFCQLHLLFDKHYGDQNELVDAIAERIQLLGGISIAIAHDVAETSLIRCRVRTSDQGLPATTMRVGVFA